MARQAGPGETGAADPPPVPPRCLAIPLRVTTMGELATSDAWSSLAGLIQVMFQTSRDFWPHAPWFGLNELVSSPRTFDQEITQALNDALERLGATWASVTETRVLRSDAPGERNVELELRGTYGDTPDHVQFSIRTTR